jgi:hypothetical protein
MKSFQNLLERKITPELFNNFLSVKELTILQFSCKSIHEIIVEWKQKFEKGLMVINNNDIATEDDIHKIQMYGHRSVCEIVVLSNINLTAVGYHYLTLIQNIQVLRIEDITPEGIRIIASSLNSLTTLSLCRLKSNSPLLSTYDFNLLTKLKNLKTLILDRFHYFSNEAGENFHKLRNLQSLTLLGVPSLFNNIEEISFLSSLTTLTALTVRRSYLNDQNLISICQNCLFLEDLDVRYNQGGYTPVGLSIDNIQHLKNLKTLHFSLSDNTINSIWSKLSVEWWKRLTNLPSLNYLDVGGSYISQEVRSISIKICNFSIAFIDLTEESDGAEESNGLIDLAEESDGAEESESDVAEESDDVAEESDGAEESD